MVNQMKEKTYKTYYISPMLGGSIAGVAATTAMYPLDTLKTRLQAAQGFRKAGGFQGTYNGLLTFVIGSIPMNSLFFVAYENLKLVFEHRVEPHHLPVTYMCIAGFCEVLACLVRVPTEIAKQRKQTYFGKTNKSGVAILIEAYKTEGLRYGVYRGFSSTVLRDLPFSFIELPAWELLKAIVRKHNNGKLTSFQSGVCGAIASAIAAIATTPFDVAKTRIMLSKSTNTTTSEPAVKDMKLSRVLYTLYSKEGFRGLFAGVMPCTGLNLACGLVFYSIYEETRRCFEEYVGER